MLKVSRTELKRREIAIPDSYQLMVDSDDRVQEDTVIARNGDEGQSLFAGMEGQIFAENGQVIIRREETLVWETDIPANARLRVEKGQQVSAGEQLSEGSKNPREILRIQGREACQLYLLEQVQQVYRSQGVAIHDKHIEVILRQLPPARHDPGRPAIPNFCRANLVDRFQFEDVNDTIIERGGRPAKAEPVVLGLTKAALNTDSFLAAASFQETTRVLTDAAVQGQRDELRGLKENVIIGKLIPVGSGFRARRMWEEEKKQAVEQLTDQRDIDSEELNELELLDLEDADLDLADLSGLAEMGIGPLGMLAGFGGGGIEDEEIDIDFSSLKDEDSEEINVDLR